MATTTTNYGLTKPSYNDSADISVINSNMDIIDTKMKEIEDASGGTVDAYTKKQTDDLLSNKADKEIISDAWNESTTYAVDQYCIYNNLFWKCLVQNSGQTPAEGTYWTNVNIGIELNNTNTLLSKKPTMWSFQMSDSCSVVKFNFAYNSARLWVISERGIGLIYDKGVVDITGTNSSYFSVSNLEVTLSTNSKLFTFILVRGELKTEPYISA